MGALVPFRRYQKALAVIQVDHPTQAGDVPKEVVGQIPVLNQILTECLFFPNFAPLFNATSN
jgi:hypothetical protein